jgi:hypothetical protein
MCTLCMVIKITVNAEQEGSLSSSFQARSTKCPFHRFSSRHVYFQISFAFSALFPPFVFFLVNGPVINDILLCLLSFFLYL